MEFLKSIYGDRALTYAELETALKGSKEIILANLAGGQYVEKAVMDGKTVELDTANQTIGQLRDAVKAFDGVDAGALNKQLAELQAKYDADTAGIKLDSALEIALLSSKVKNTKAVKALLDRSVIKLDGDKLLGLDEQLTGLKASDGYLFEPQQPAAGGARVDSGKPHGEPPASTEPTSLAGALQQKFGAESHQI